MFHEDVQILPDVGSYVKIFTIFPYLQAARSRKRFSKSHNHVTQPCYTNATIKYKAYIYIVWKHKKHLVL